MNLGGVTSQITSLMNRRDFTANTSLQTTFINQAIMRIQRELRIPAMEKSVNVTIAAPYSGLVIPNDLLELIRIVPAANNTELRKCELDRALGLATVSSGLPEEYSRQGGLWILGPAPNAGDVIRIDYYAEFAALSVSTDTNILTEIAWDLLVFAALVQAAIYYKDARQDTWEGQYQQVLADLQNQADEDELNGAANVVPCYFFPLDTADPDGSNAGNTIP